MTFRSKTASRDEPTSPADEWHGISEREKQHLMGNDQVDSQLRNSELVPISVLKQMQEFDRRPGLPDAYYTPERWHALKTHIAMHGITSPAWIDYNPDTQELHLSEGNHRLGVAEELGMTHLPAVVYKSGRKSRGNSIFAPKAVQPDMSDVPEQLRQHQDPYDYIPSYLKPSDVGLDSLPWGKVEPYGGSQWKESAQYVPHRFKRGTMPFFHHMDIPLRGHNEYLFNRDEHFHEGQLKGGDRELDKYLDYENPMDYLRAHLMQLADEYGVKDWRVKGQHANTWAPSVPGNVNNVDISSGWAHSQDHSIETGPITSRASYLMGLHELAHLVGGTEEMHDRESPYVHGPGQSVIEAPNTKYRGLGYEQQYRPVEHEYDRAWGGYPSIAEDPHSFQHSQQWVHAPMENAIEGVDPDDYDEEPEGGGLVPTSPFSYEENKLETEARAWEWALQHSKVHVSAPVLHQMMSAMMTYADPKSISYFSPTAKRLFEQHYGFGGEKGEYPLPEDEYGPGATGATEPWEEWATHRDPNQPRFLPTNTFDRNNWERQQDEKIRRMNTQKAENEKLYARLEPSTAPPGMVGYIDPTDGTAYHFPEGHPIVNWINSGQQDPMQQPGDVDLTPYMQKAAGWRVSMADRTGDPQVDALIEAFLKERPGDWTYSEPHETMDQYRNPEWAHGNCQVISEQFADFAKQHGFKAYVTDTSTEEMGYKPTGPGGEIGFNENDEMEYGHYPEHTIVTIVVNDPAHPYGKEYYIDFSASQYGYSDHPKVTSKTAAADLSGAMVAIYPPPDVAAKMAVEGGEPADQLHITIIYFQEKAADREMESWDSDVARIVQDVAGAHEPVEVTIGGTARFEPPGKDEHPIVGTVDAPGIVELHVELKQALNEAGFMVNEDHGFLPHLTFSYVDADADDPEIDTGASWTANSVVLVVGGQKTEFKLGGGEALSVVPRAAGTRSPGLGDKLNTLALGSVLYSAVPPFEDAVRRVQSVLTPDLLHKSWRERWSPDNPHAGHCYAASEALYHMLGGRGAGLTPMQVQHEGGSHWFLGGPNGEIIDPTHGQFESPVPYEQARGRGFLTAHPSKRAAEIIRRVSDQHASSWKVADEDFEQKHPRDHGKFTVKHDQHEVKVHDHMGKHLGTVKRCKHCGVLYQKPADHKGRMECPTCGLDPERVLRQSAGTPLGQNPDAVAQSLGWNVVREGTAHRMYGWTDPNGNSHMVTGYGAHGDPTQQARHVRQNMTKCMNGACTHPMTNVGAPMMDEPGAPVLRQGQQVEYGGQHYWIMDMDGDLAHIYDEKGAENIVPVTQLRAAHFWYSNEGDEELAERVRKFNEDDHPDTNPDYAFVYYQGKLEMQQWHHNIEHSVLADQLLKTLGTDVLKYDGKLENDTTSDWVAGDVWNGREVKFHIPQLAKPEVVEDAKAAVKEVLRGKTSSWALVSARS